jgi:uncharacterized protein YbaR (Trm112 family)
MARILGTDRRKWDTLGIVWPTVCPQCRKDVWFSGVKGVFYFYLLFIPIVQRDSQHYLVCPECRYSIELSREEYLYAKDMNEQAVTYDRGRLDGEDYDEALQKFDRETETVLPKPLQPVSATEAEQKDEFQPIGVE